MGSGASPRYIAAVSHKDLDGLAATAVVLSSRLATDPELRYVARFIQPQELTSTLVSLSFLGASLVEIYIVDIAAAAESWKETLDVLRRFVEKGVRVTWIDHHPSTLEKVDELEKTGVTCRVGDAVSAATLVRDLIPYTSSPEFYEKLVAVAEAYDGGYKTEGPLAEVLETLADALALEPSDDEFRAALLSAWVKGRELIPDEVALRGEKAFEVYAEILRAARGSVIVDTPRLVVVDLRNIRVRGFAGKLLSALAAETGKIVAAVFRLGSHSAVISARAPPTANVNLNEVFSRLGAEYGGSGGGHARAASLRIPLPYADRAVKRLVDLIGSS